MKTKPLLTLLFFAFCLLSSPTPFVKTSAATTTVSMTFKSKTWETAEGEPKFTCLQEGFLMSSIHGVQLSSNRTGSAITVVTYPSITAISFLVNGNTLGKGTMTVSFVDEDKETTFSSQVIDTSLGSGQRLTFDTYGSGQVKFQIHSTAQTIYLASMTVTYGDTSLSAAHQYATTFLHETDNKVGQCDRIDWSKLQQDYLGLDAVTQGHLQHGIETSLFTTFSKRYQYLQSGFGYEDFLHVTPSLSQISLRQTKPSFLNHTVMLIVSLCSGFVYLWIRSKAWDLN